MKFKNRGAVNRMTEPNMPRKTQAGLDMLDDLLMRQQNLIKEMRGGAKPAEQKAAYTDTLSYEADAFIGGLVALLNDPELDALLNDSSLTTLKHLEPMTREEITQSPETNANHFDYTSPVPPLESFNPTKQPVTKQPVSPKRRKIIRRVWNVAFWLGLIAVFITGLTYITAGGGSRGLWGFSVYEVLTDSMQSEIPQGSLVLVKERDQADIQIGDDITFFMDEENRLTHRVTAIYENYEDSGQRGFETQGLENPLPDEDVVYAGEVIGKVIFHIPGFGGAVTFIKERWYIILIPLAGLTGVILLLKFVFKQEDGKEILKRGKAARRKAVTQ
jgi:signal peptidase